MNHDLLSIVNCSVTIKETQDPILYAPPGLKSRCFQDSTLELVFLEASLNPCPEPTTCLSQQRATSHPPQTTDYFPELPWTPSGMPLDRWSHLIPGLTERDQSEGSWGQCQRVQRLILCHWT